VYKNRSETPADYLSRNVVVAIIMSEKNLREKQSTDPLCTTVKKILKAQPIQPIKKKFLKPAEILWT
jgi:hypothetical protein